VEIGAATKHVFDAGRRASPSRVPGIECGRAEAGGEVSRGREANTRST